MPSTPGVPAAVILGSDAAEPARRRALGLSRPVRVKRGEQPTHSSLTPFQRWAWKVFKDRVSAKPIDPVLEENLVKAHMRIRADEYVAFVLGASVVSAAGLAAAGFALGLLLTLSGAPILGLGIGVLLPVLGTFGTYAMLSGIPASTSKRRGRAIDAKISAAMSFVSAMSSADVNIDQIFRELGRQKVYGQVAEEAAWITRDTELLGTDILTAIKSGAMRTPSKRFQDFLQGVVTTATSGGQLKPYFVAKAQQYEQENKLDLLKRTETLGLLAETFVTVVVAFPLFLVIIIAIFAIIGGGGALMIEFLWVIVGVMIPVFQFFFIWFMYGLAQET